MPKPAGKKNFTLWVPTRDALLVEREAARRKVSMHTLMLELLEPALDELRRKALETADDDIDAGQGPDGPP